MFEHRVIQYSSSPFLLQGHIYTGTADGKVLHIYQGEIQILATLGKPPCGKKPIYERLGKATVVAVDWH